MRTKVQEIRKETNRTETAREKCQHHWLIEAAGGPTSRGLCKICGATKDFYNAIPEPETLVKRQVAFTEMPKLDIGAEETPVKSSS